MPDADKDLFFKALDDIKAKYNPSGVMVCITGGEPLMRKDLAGIIRTVREKGFPVGIVTNGFALGDSRFEELINAGLCTITVSIDGLEDCHNAMRGNAESFKKAVHAVRLCSSFKKSGINPSFDFDVVTCVWGKNLPQLPELENFLFSDCGIDSWRLFTIFPTGRSQGGGFALSSREYRQLLDYIAGRRSAGRKGLSYSCEGWLSDYELKVRSSYYFCRAGINYAGIFADGSVGGCTSVRGSDFRCGNLNDKSFLDIWENCFDLFRNRSWACKGKCSRCKEYKYCLGNGMHLHTELGADVLKCNMP